MQEERNEEQEERQEGEEQAAAEEAAVEEAPAGCKFPKWLGGVVVAALVVAIIGAALVAYDMFGKKQILPPTAKEVAVAVVEEVKILATDEILQGVITDQIKQAVGQTVVNTDEIAQKVAEKLSVPTADEVADKVVAKLPQQPIQPQPGQPGPQPGPVQPGPSIIQPGPTPTQPAPVQPAPAPTFDRKAELKRLKDKYPVQ